MNVRCLKKISSYVQQEKSTKSKKDSKDSALEKKKNDIIATLDQIDSSLTDSMTSAKEIEEDIIKLLKELHQSQEKKIEIANQKSNWDVVDISVGLKAFILCRCNIKVGKILDNFISLWNKKDIEGLKSLLNEVFNVFQYVLLEFNCFEDELFCFQEQIRKELHDEWQGGDCKLSIEHFSEKEKIYQNLAQKASALLAYKRESESDSSLII